MVFFVDESGHPHPSDPVPCPVLAAVGVPASRSRMLMGTLFRLKRDILGITETSHNDDRFKAKAVLNEHTHRRVPAKWQFVEELVNAAVNLPVVSFFIVMDRPPVPQALDAAHLPCYVQFLLERMNQYMLDHHPDSVAPIVFDSRSTGSDAVLTSAISNFLYRHAKGRLWRNVLETPFFVSSALTPGIQIADYFAGVVRQHWEMALHGREEPPAYAAAVDRLYGQIRGTVANLEIPDAVGTGMVTLYGEYRMGSHYWETGD
jgi:hypothetical protein